MKYALSLVLLLGAACWGQTNLGNGTIPTSGSITLSDAAPDCIAWNGTEYVRMRCDAPAPKHSCKIDESSLLIPKAQQHCDENGQEIVAPVDSGTGDTPCETEAQFWARQGLLTPKSSPNNWACHEDVRRTEQAANDGRLRLYAKKATKAIEGRNWVCGPPALIMLSDGENNMYCLYVEPEPFDSIGDVHSFPAQTGSIRLTPNEWTGWEHDGVQGLFLPNPKSKHAVAKPKRKAAKPKGLQ